MTLTPAGHRFLERLALRFTTPVGTAYQHDGATEEAARAFLAEQAETVTDSSGCVGCDLGLPIDLNDCHSSLEGVRFGCSRGVAPKPSPAPAEAVSEEALEAYEAAVEAHAFADAKTIRRAGLQAAAPIIAREAAADLRLFLADAREDLAKANAKLARYESPSDEALWRLWSVGRNKLGLENMRAILAALGAGEG